MVLAGLAIGFGIFGLFSPVAGDQVYNCVPVALSTMLCPRHNESSGGATTVDGCMTVITTESIRSQPKTVVPLTL